MSNLFFVSNIFLNMIQVFSDYIVLQTFLGKPKYELKHVSISYIIYYIAITYAFLGTRIPLIITVANILGLIMLSHLYHGSILKKIFTVAFLYVLFSIIENSIALLYKDNFLLLESNDFNFISAIVIVKTVTFITALLIRKYFSNEEKIEIPNWYNNILISVELGSLILLLIVTYQFGDGGVFTTITLAMILIFNILIFFIYQGITNLVSLTLNQQAQLSKKEVVESQVAQMEDTLHEVRRLEHDMKNKLTPVYAMATQGQSDEIADYIMEMLENFPTRKFDARSGIMELDSIINYKLQRAKNLGIRAKVRLELPRTLKIPGMDLAVIMGNLIDNAIEASSKVEDKWIYVRLKYHKGLVRIDVKNSFDGIVLKKGDKIISRKEKSLLHGYGITSTRQLLEEYGGDLECYYNEKEFHVIGSFFG